MAEPIKSGYAELNGRAVLLCEYIEYKARYCVEKNRLKNEVTKVNMTDKIEFHIPPLLVWAINHRYEQMTEHEKAVVINFHTFGSDGRTWKAWLEEHVRLFPQDEVVLRLVESHFRCDAMSPVIYQLYGPFDRPWRMDHEWWQKQPG